MPTKKKTKKPTKAAKKKSAKKKPAKQPKKSPKKSPTKHKKKKKPSKVGQVETISNSEIAPTGPTTDQITNPMHVIKLKHLDGVASFNDDTPDTPDTPTDT
jgi:hypothetical protein